MGKSGGVSRVLGPQPGDTQNQQLSQTVYYYRRRSINIAGGVLELLINSEMENYTPNYQVSRNPYLSHRQQRHRTNYPSDRGDKRRLNTRAR